MGEEKWTLELSAKLGDGGGGGSWGKGKRGRGKKLKQ